MGVELPLHVVVTILEWCVTFSGVKLSIRSFVLFLKFLRQLVLDKRLEQKGYHDYSSDFGGGEGSGAIAWGTVNFFEDSQLFLESL